MTITNRQKEELENIITGLKKFPPITKICSNKIITILQTSKNIKILEDGLKNDITPMQVFLELETRGDVIIESK